jgi:hypothetical protein
LPGSAQEGFNTGISLMAHALEELKKNIKKRCQMQVIKEFN